MYAPVIMTVLFIDFKAASTDTLKEITRKNAVIKKGTIFTADSWLPTQICCITEVPEMRYLKQV
jgi:hypothetical protein